MGAVTTNYANDAEVRLKQKLQRHLQRSCQYKGDVAFCDGSHRQESISICLYDTIECKERNIGAVSAQATESARFSRPYWTVQDVQSYLDKGLSNDRKQKRRREENMHG